MALNQDLQPYFVKVVLTVISSFIFICNMALPKQLKQTGSSCQASCSQNCLTIDILIFEFQHVVQPYVFVLLSRRSLSVCTSLILADPDHVFSAV